MPERNYIGDPIDATMQYIKDRNKSGETVGGTTEDDHGEVTTDAFPSALPKDEFDKQEREIISNKILHPNITLKEFCKQFKYDYQNTSTFLADLRRNWENKLRDSRVFLKLQPPGNRATKSTPSDEHKKRELREYIQENPDADMGELRAQTTLSDNVIKGMKGAVVSQQTTDDPDEEAGEVDAEYIEERVDELADQHLESRPEKLGKALVALLDEFEALSDELETQREQNRQLVELSDQAEPGLSAIDADVWFKIVNGQPLEEETRREIFGLVLYE